MLTPLSTLLCRLQLSLDAHEDLTERLYKDKDSLTRSVVASRNLLDRHFHKDLQDVCMELTPAHVHINTAPNRQTNSFPAPGHTLTSAHVHAEPSNARDTLVDGTQARIEANIRTRTSNLYSSAELVQLGTTCTAQQNLYSSAEPVQLSRTCTARQSLYSLEDPIRLSRICTAQQNLYSSADPVQLSRICTARASANPTHFPSLKQNLA